jgi:uncharacterized membrane protein YphA (DoxX/SURF4 family)
MDHQTETAGISDLWQRRFIALARILIGFFLFMSGVMKLGPQFDMAATLQLFTHGLPALRHLTLSNEEFLPLVSAHPDLRFVTVDENPLFKTLAAGHPAGWYKQFLIKRAIPHASAFAFLVTWGEIVIGFMLLIGLATGLAGLIAIFMHLNYHLASSWMGGASAFINLYAIVITALMVTTSAGRTWGVDAWLARRVPMKILW